ncbi:MAG: Bax inhibitor-1/YccA family protein [Planctomycetaceae bacterium]|jgi:uncharacterized YccA/Bax inhibitor family protein
MRSGNPALNAKAFERFDVYEQSSTMTIEGTATKTAILLAVVVTAAWFTWNQSLQQNPIAGPLMFGGAIVGFITAFVTIFKKQWAPITAPVYAAAEGLFLGGISAIFEAGYPGIAVQAMGLTFGTLFGLLLAYRTGLIRATENFKLGVFAATSGIFLLYLVNFIMSFFSGGIPHIHQSGTVGIGFSLFVVVIASLNLVLDFDFIEEGAARGAPKYMEWYGAFGLLVTLVWLYLEILRLLAKLRGRD